MIIWHAAELSVTLICMGIPVCRPLYGKLPLDGISRQQPRQDQGTAGEGIRYGVHTTHTIGGSDFNGSDRTRAASDEVKDDGDVDRESDFGAANPAVEITVVPGSFRRLSLSHYRDKGILGPIIE